MEHRSWIDRGRRAGHRMSVAIAALTAAALLFVAAPELAAQTSFKDDGGRTVALPAHPTRVFPAGPPASIDLFAVAPDKMLGWTRGTHPREGTLVPSKYAELPELGRLTGRGNTVNLEDLVRVKPDLVLDIGTINDTYVSLADRVQEQTKIPYVLMGGSLLETPATLRKLGAVLDEAQGAEPMARYAEDLITRLRSRVDTVPMAQRPTIYLARGPRGLQTVRAGGINAETLDMVGAHNVAAAAEGGNLMDVSMEQVLAWQPDVILTFNAAFFQAIWDDPVWQQVKAVPARRVYLSPTNPFPWVDEPPAVNRLIGALWLAKLLHPQLFPEDIRGQVREFFDLFYHRVPTDGEIDTLLAATVPGAK